LVEIGGFLYLFQSYPPQFLPCVLCESPIGLGFDVVAEFGWNVPKDGVAGDLWMGSEPGLHAFVEVKFVGFGSWVEFENAWAQRIRVAGIEHVVVGAVAHERIMRDDDAYARFFKGLPQGEYDGGFQGFEGIGEDDCFACVA
jgi:hypothetical protein